MFATLPGKIFQMAYIVEDIDAAVGNWSSLLNIGPFVVMRHHRFNTATFRGAATEIDISLAFAFSGDVNVELIQVHGKGSSVYSEYRANKGFGLQHIGILSEDIDADTLDFAGRGFGEIQRTVDVSNIETRFFDTQGVLGVEIELIRSTPELKANFANLRKMNDGWDGKTALLDVG